MEKCKNVQELRTAIFAQKVSVKEVVSYYCQMAYTIGRKLNLTADERFSEALKEAEEKDKQLQKCIKDKLNPEKELGLLFGIPISVKDQLYVKGTITAMSVPSRAEKRVDFDAVSVQLLKEQGAIVFVKGNCSTA